MKKNWIISTTLAMFLLVPFFITGQNAIKIRVGGNTARFMSEAGSNEKIYPYIDTLQQGLGPFSDFTHQGNLGLDAEFMVSLSDKIWLGLEVSSNKMSGENDNPPYYNFQFTDFNQLQVTDTVSDVVSNMITRLPLKYNSSLLNVVANFRYYPLPNVKLRPFLKLSGGVSFVATELALKNPEDWVGNNTNPNIVYGRPVLYSRGTSDSKEGRWPAFTLGGGAGLEFQISEKVALYADASYYMVNADMVDGRPNFDYNENNSLLEHFNTQSFVGKISFGLCYTIGENFNIFGGGSGGGKSYGSGGRVHPYLPFYEIKRK